MYIDSHAHLNFKAFEKDFALAIKRAQAAGVSHLINVGTTEETSQKAIEIAQNFPNCFASVSLHPIFVEKFQFDKAKFEELALEPKVVAVGETGLDYFHFTKQGQSLTAKGLSLMKINQMAVFTQLLDLAKELGKPVILHSRGVYPERSRRALDDVLDVVSAYKIPGVIHCFTQDYAHAKKFLDLGFLISFTGIVTLEPELEEVVKKIPLDSIMIETDSPFLAPLAYKGKRNEPAYVMEVAKKISEIKKIPLSKVAQITSQNAFDLFGLKD